MISDPLCIEAEVGFIQ